MHTQGYHIAHVQVFFRLSDWFHCDHTLAYIEWFRQIGEAKELLCMSLVSYTTWEGCCHTAIVPIHLILQSCHLTPKFSHQCNVTWTAENVLHKCLDFFLSSHLSIYMFQMCICISRQHLIHCNQKMCNRAEEDGAADLSKPQQPHCEKGFCTRGPQDCLSKPWTWDTYQCDPRIGDTFYCDNC